MTIRTALLLLALLVPGVSQATEVAGTVKSLAGNVRVIQADGTAIAVSGALADRLRPFAGHPVRLRGELRGSRMSEARLLSPVRDERKVDVRKKDGLWTLQEADGTIHRAFGNTNLLEANRKTFVDLWTFEDGAACVVAVQAQTTGEWTFLSKKILGYEVPAGFIHGLSRSVWVTETRANGDLYIRRGDDEGWVGPGKLAQGEPLLSRAGLTDRLR